MRIIVINPKEDFQSHQIADMKAVGELVFIKGLPNYNSKTFSDNTEKVILLGPEQVNWKFPQSDINKINNLKAVFVPTTGFDWVDGKYLRSKNITLTNVPKYSTESVAEYAISLMLNTAKKLALVMKNKWKIDYDQHQSWEIKNKTMGIVGLGTIGTRIAELGKSMDMKVIYWSRKSKDKRFKRVGLTQLLKQADFIFPAMARNTETKNMLNKQKLNTVKKGAFIISITSDDLFDFNYAVSLVKKGLLAGVALESEDKKINDYQGNIWITPPIAWFTKEAFVEDMRIWTETAIAFVKGKPQNVVN